MSDESDMTMTVDTDTRQVVEWEFQPSVCELCKREHPHLELRSKNGFLENIGEVEITYRCMCGNFFKAWQPIKHTKP